MNKRDQTNYKLQLHNVLNKQKGGYENATTLLRKLKCNAKYKNLHRVGIMYNLKNKLFTE